MDEIRFGNDIAEVIGSYLTLKRAGTNFKAQCPFHKEKTPSFHVNSQRQIFHCFGCGAGGDVFSFIMQHESVDFMTAARMLAQRAGIKLEIEEGEAGEASEKEVLYRIHQGVAEFFQRCLAQMKGAAAARDYLAERDLGGEAAAEFMIGYAPNRWDAAMRWSVKHKFSRDQMEKAGLVVRSTKEGSEESFYDRFRNRLMFPIRDEQGRVMAFSGRALEEGPRVAKYVNSPETLLFKKSRVLYAMDKARRAIVDTREAVVCEGQIDVIRCHQVGIVTAVAAQGTAFTEDHARVLRRYADSICLVFDPDKAGQDASVRAATVFMDAGLAVRIASLPEGEDPDSFIRKRGAEAFKEVLASAVSAVGFQVSVLSSRENLSSEVGTMRAAKSVLETISHSPNAVQLAKLLQQAAEQLNVPASALTDDLRFMLRRGGGGRSQGAGRREQEPGDGEEGVVVAKPVEEVALCEHIVRAIDHPEVAEAVARYVPQDVISDPACRVIIGASLKALEAGEDLQLLLRRTNAPESVQRFAAQLQMMPTKTRGNEFVPLDAVRGLILRIWRRRLERERDALRRRGEQDLSDEEGERRVVLGNYVHVLKGGHWQDGAEIIEFELVARDDA